MSTRRLPAEWEAQSGIMLVWPHAHSDWRDTLADVEPVFLEISRHVCANQRLLIVAFDVAHIQHIKSQLVNANVNCNAIEIVSAPSNDVWARDIGPICVWENDQIVLLDFTFNGWGNKHPATLDNNINAQLRKCGAFSKRPFTAIDFVLEGGSIDCNGAGTVLTTAQCLLSPERNPNLNKQNIENKLTATLGANHILWLHHGELMGDDTDGHIDTLARFCNESTIIYTQCQNKQDSHYQALQKMEHELASMRTTDGEAFQLVPLPLPPAVYNNKRQRLPATYANFLIINNAVLLPVYNLPTDTLAEKIMRQCFPTRNIISINCLPLIEQHGSLHCVTMQFPAGVLTPATTF